MITEVKMQVTPDLSKRVQEIVFANGGGLESRENHKKIKYTEALYLYINENKKMTYDKIKGKQYFQDHHFIEVLPYDFIASQGEQGWLPKYNEKALFSDDCKTWCKYTFKVYIPESAYPYHTMPLRRFVYCKPLPKSMLFTQFLMDNEAYKKYIHNSKIENQRWECISDYINYSDIKNQSSTDWIYKAFNWKLQNEELGYWSNLHNEWKEICKNNEVVWDV